MTKMNVWVKLEHKAGHKTGNMLESKMIIENLVVHKIILI